VAVVAVIAAVVGSLGSACSGEQEFRIPVEEAVALVAVLATVPGVAARILAIAAVVYILEEQTDRGKMEHQEVVDTGVAGNSAEVELRMVAGYTEVWSVPGS